MYLTKKIPDTAQGTVNPETESTTEIINTKQQFENGKYNGGGEGTKKHKQNTHTKQQTNK